MFNHWLKKIGIIIGLSIFHHCSLADTQVQNLLKSADAYRQESQAVQINVVIKNYLNQSLENTREYLVHVFPNQQSLVIMKSTVEAGQMVLMLGDNYWLIMPKSSRPIRITPIQKLIGEASTGDIATLSWGEDYDGKVIAENDQTITLDIIAQRKGLTYSRIELILDKATSAPLSAKLYVQSGKLVKLAKYTLGNLNGRTMVTQMTLMDAIQTNKRTEVYYLQQSPSNLPELAFNPHYLLKNRTIGQ